MNQEEAGSNFHERRGQNARQRYKVTPHSGGGTDFGFMVEKSGGGGVDKNKMTIS